MIIPGGAAGPRAPATTALQLGYFRVLWLTAALSGVGEFIYTVAASWLMLTLTGSTVWVGAVVSARILPMLIATPLTGAVADAWDRRVILLSAHAGMFAIAAAMTALSASGRMTPQLLLALIVLLGAVTAFNMPAWHAFLPDIVPAPLVGSAVSLQAVAASIAAATGPPIGGILLALSSPAAVFLINGLTYIPVFAVIYLLRPPGPPAHRASIRASIRSWARDLGGNRYGRAFFAAGCFAAASGAVAATLPKLADALGDERTFGVLLGISGVGTVAAALVRRRALERLGAALVPVALALEAVALAMIALPAGARVVALGMFLAGVFGLLGGATLETAVQLATPARLRGRAMSAYLFVFMGSLAVSSIAVGSAATAVGAAPALAGTGVLLMLASVALSVWPPPPPGHGAPVGAGGEGTPIGYTLIDMRRTESTSWRERAPQSPGRIRLRRTALPRRTT